MTSSQQLQSYQDLYEYLMRLAGELKSLGELDLAVEVERASRFASGLQTEFCIAAQEALRSVVRKQPSKLTETQRESILNVVHQINVAFTKIGGA